MFYEKINYFNYIIYNHQDIEYFLRFLLLYYSYRGPYRGIYLF